MDYTDALRHILSAQLGPGYPPTHFQAETALLGSIPELDSMAVVGILTAIEEELGIEVVDDEISAEIFRTVGSLDAFVQERIAHE